MSIFSRIFGSSNARRAERIIQKAEKETHEQFKPAADIGVAIVEAANNCTQSLKPMFKVPEGADEKSPENYPEMWVFYEFLYFFMHLTMRVADRILSEEQIRTLQNFIGPVIASTGVDSFCGHWPTDLKEKIKAEFYSKLNNAEIEYSKCKELLSKESSLTGNSLFSKLAWNVAELSGNPMNPGTIISVITTAVAAYKAMNLDSLLQKASEAL